MTPESDITWGPWVIADLFTLTLGRAVNRQQRLIEQLEQARRALADQEVAEERRRIARELHDLAGHTLAAMLLHVTGARHVLHRDLAEAERALLDAETVGRASLDQIRATVASLRADERGTDPALAGVADVGPLVEEYRRAGLVVDLSVAESAADLTGPVGVAVHRVAREGLANVARHAPGNRVELRVDCVDGGVRLLVVDQGRPAAAPDPQALHFGLVGMAERAARSGAASKPGPPPTGGGSRPTSRTPPPHAITSSRRDPGPDRRRPACGASRGRPHPRDRLTASRWSPNVATVTRSPRPSSCTSRMSC